jgi:hypothetical protein
MLYSSRTHMALIRLDLITEIKFDEKYKSRRKIRF